MIASVSGDREPRLELAPERIGGGRAAQLCPERLEQRVERAFAPVGDRAQIDRPPGPLQAASDCGRHLDWR